MVRLLLKYKWHLVIIIVLMIIEPTINSILNFWLQNLFNLASPGADKVALLRMLTVGFLLWMLKRLITFSSAVIKDRYICRAKQDVKHKLFLNLFKLDISEVSQHASSGEYISIFTNDILLLEQRFFSQVISLISSIFSIIVLGASFIALNRVLAVAIICFGIISLFVPLMFSKRLNENNYRYSNQVSKLTQKIKEYFVAYPTIKNYSIEQTIIEKFDENNTDTEDAKFEADYTISLANNVGMLLSWFMQFIGVGLGIMLVIKGEILIGTVIAAQSFASDLALPLQNLVVNINSIRSVKSIVEKINDLTNVEDKGNIESEYIPSEKVFSDNCDVIFDDLYLKLGSKTIINHFSYKFEYGKKYLIVGLNGSGKSSLFKSLKKWFNRYDGKIYINDTDISRLSSNDISRIISYINENVSLFSGSVRDNILLFRQYSNDILDKVILDSHMELDLDKQIGDEGRNVSSGEQRRIEIARSLLKSVKVLIFDEVVSTLDIETAYEIERLALEFNKTVIFISHNFSGKLVKEYDEILVMKDGKLISHGNYDMLIENCEYFKRICEIKFG